MKKTSKIISILLIMMMLLCIGTTSFAEVAGITKNPGELQGQTVQGTEKINDLGNQIITILTTIGIVISVIILIVLGLKYMMGSAEEKAEYKKTMMPYIIGAACIFAASAIAGIIYGFLSNVSA